MVEFSMWKDFYNKWLRIMYFTFVFHCNKNGLYSNMNWKSARPYNLFCSMIYHSSSKKILDHEIE